jgi:hypothetical protein
MPEMVREMILFVGHRDEVTDHPELMERVVHVKTWQDVLAHESAHKNPPSSDDG